MFVVVLSVISIGKRQDFNNLTGTLLPPLSQATFSTEQVFLIRSLLFDGYQKLLCPNSDV